MSQNWRPETDAVDFFGNQKKSMEIEKRRPARPKAGDLVGPGVAASAVRITDFNDLLVRYDGFFSADAGALNAPNSTEAFVGTVSSDAALGGIQTFTGLTSGLKWYRVFTRNALDPAAIYWGTWVGANKRIGQDFSLRGTTVVMPNAGLGIVVFDANSTSQKNGATRAFVKASVTAKAPINQDTVWYLELWVNGVPAPGYIDLSYAHNGGDAAVNLGTTLSGWIDVPSNSTLMYRVFGNVGGGGGPNYCTAVSIRADYYP